MHYKYLFFDLDRTLWDYDANANKALTEIFHTFNLHNYFTKPASFIKSFNHHNDLLWENYRKGDLRKEELRTRRFRNTLGENSISGELLAERINRKYMEITPTFNILAPNTIETLDYLSGKGYLLYILTNGFLGTQRKKMTNSNILSYFKRIYSSEEAGINKPHKEIFHWAVSSLHANKKECLMIGDDIQVDIHGAMQYGLDAAWFNPRNAVSEHLPTYEISDMQELMTIL